MKVTLDLDKLLEEGSIDEAEYDKLSRLSAGGTTALAFNILIGFGVIAVGAGSLALLPTATTAIVLGLVVCAAGVALVFARYEQWTLLASICVLVGALLFGGGVIIADEGSVRSFLIVAAVFAAAGVLARSVLLTVLAVLALSSCIGTRTGYLHASYYLGVEEPSATVVLFTLFGIAMFQLSKRLSADYEKIAVAASRTGVFLVNFGFWIGSLWGDRIETIKLVVADWVFALLWAVALVATGVWGWKRNRRCYTQWFERLGASPESVLIAGLLALGFAVGLRAVNVRLGKMA
jgi:hypothetical protein